MGRPRSWEWWKIPEASRGGGGAPMTAPGGIGPLIRLILESTMRGRGAVSR
jgi:hypothetical protein